MGGKYRDGGGGGHFAPATGIQGHALSHGRVVWLTIMFCRFEVRQGSEAAQLIHHHDKHILGREGTWHVGWAVYTTGVVLAVCFAVGISRAAMRLSSN
jgi:hypothetical protein